MRRRELMLLLGGAMTAAHALRAQQKAMPVVGDLIRCVWQAQSSGLYDSQDANLDGLHMRGKFRTDAEGRYLIRTVRPVNYPIPSDGPVGRMLRATVRPTSISSSRLRVRAGDDAYFRSNRRICRQRCSLCGQGFTDLRLRAARQL
jgi:hypothetical protein